MDRLYAQLGVALCFQVTIGCQYICGSGTAQDDHQRAEAVTEHWAAQLSGSGHFPCSLGATDRGFMVLAISTAMHEREITKPSTSAMPTQMGHSINCIPPVNGTGSRK